MRERNDAGHPTARRRVSEAGFSLVELSVILAVLGVIAALAIPSFRSIMPRVRLDNNALLLVNEINLMRREAIAKSTDFRVVFDPGSETYSLQRRDSVTGVWAVIGASRLSGTDLEGVTGFSAPVTLVAQAGGAVNVPPVVGGSVNFGYITLQIPDGSRKKRVKVEPLGRVSVQRWQGGTSWVDE